MRYNANCDKKQKLRATEKRSVARFGNGGVVRAAQRAVNSVANSILCTKMIVARIVDLH